MAVILTMYIRRTESDRKYRNRDINSCAQRVRYNRALCKILEIIYRARDSLLYTNTSRKIRSATRDTTCGLRRVSGMAAIRIHAMLRFSKSRDDRLLATNVNPFTGAALSALEQYEMRA